MQVIFAYDRRYALHEVALCDQELHALRYLLPPTTRLGHAGALAAEIVPLDLIWKELGWSNKRRQQQRQQRRRRKQREEAAKGKGILVPEQQQGGEEPVGEDAVMAEQEDDNDDEEDDDDDDLDMDLFANLEEAPVAQEAPSSSIPHRLPFLERQWAETSAADIRRLVNQQRPDLRPHWQRLELPGLEPATRAGILELLLDALEKTRRQ
jgi:hypothetical protein